ncbi:cobalt-zinc-cadmium efflux system protein [Tropicibacter naphthalenivorans]|uniref:Cadmium, cobalt and zinc/H(+)-K(+) antiporter n=2 Tax=Tropicibacter naphthalenivorans TaxID=441103 RepID=A0A0P1G821_9RHOB|nr:Cadmium, cobalt and zinc/H(+)-K(+) antiporter [Tropicibacter naphthalenivorans]SMC96036.1 cobalt-zinc-cadmium efflux system protein [Tropicibacter naphthalenivorans]
MAAAVGVNLLLTIAQIIGGIVSGSLAMIADALHNFSDAASLIIAFWARKIARRPADDTMTFGYARAEIVAALINLTTLIVVGFYLIYEAVMRFFAPEPVTGWLVMVIAGVALVIDLITAALTYSMAKNSVNIRAAFMHNLADAMGSVAVILAGALIWAFGWNWVDPLMTLLIAGYILWMAWSEIGGVVRILMLGTPPQMAPETVLATAEEVDGVDSLHHAHLWSMDEHDAALQAHLVVKSGAWARADAIKQEVKMRLSEVHGLTHVTLEMECATHICSGVKRIGH